MKASFRKIKHGPSKDPEPFTESLPSKRAVFEKISGALRSSVAPRWRTASKNDPWQWEDYENIILSNLSNCNDPNPTTLIHKLLKHLS